VRSRSEILLGTLVLCTLLSSAAANPAPRSAHRPDDAEIATAVAKLSADPNLASARKVRTLRWVDDAHERPRTTTPAWIAWLGELFAWLADAGRLLLWVGCVLLLSVAGLYVYRFARDRAGHALPPRGLAPTHVRDLDIRPESLPDDIGAAALDLWERGEQRAALSLLYRGLLSRLAHVYALPIRDSSTEGDCMELAARQLDSSRATYVARLVGTWQHCVYGGTVPGSAEVKALCADFRL
jgi:Domain of unknown function (DUF4129)